MLDVARKEYVEDPVEAKQWVEDQGNVVHPGVLVAQRVPEKGMFGVRIA